MGFPNQQEIRNDEPTPRIIRSDSDDAIDRAIVGDFPLMQRVLQSVADQKDVIAERIGSLYEKSMVVPQCRAQPITNSSTSANPAIVQTLEESIELLMIRMSVKVMEEVLEIDIAQNIEEVRTYLKNLIAPMLAMAIEKRAEFGNRMQVESTLRHTGAQNLPIFAHEAVMFWTAFRWNTNQQRIHNREERRPGDQLDISFANLNNRLRELEPLQRTDPSAFDDLITCQLAYLAHFFQWEVYVCERLTYATDPAMIPDMDSQRRPMPWKLVIDDLNFHISERRRMVENIIPTHITPFYAWTFPSQLRSLAIFELMSIDQKIVTAETFVAANTEKSVKTAMRTGFDGTIAQLVNIIMRRASSLWIPFLRDMYRQKRGSDDTLHRAEVFVKCAIRFWGKYYRLLADERTSVEFGTPRVLYGQRLQNAKQYLYDNQIKLQREGRQRIATLLREETALLDMMHDCSICICANELFQHAPSRGPASEERIIA